MTVSTPPPQLTVSWRKVPGPPALPPAVEEPGARRGGRAHRPAGAGGVVLTNILAMNAIMTGPLERLKTATPSPAQVTN